MQMVVDTKLYSDAPVLSGDFINTSDVKVYFSASHIQSSVKTMLSLQLQYGM